MIVISVGSTVGNYTIASKLGEGAMATVFLAEHPRIGKRVAIKVIHPELSTSQEMVSRFFTEARAVSQIHHENVVEIQDFGQTPDGDNFIVMELLEGDTLASRLSRGPLDPARAVRISLQIAAALAAAHGRGVIHRDLKPDNIFLIQRGAESDFVKILDFGLAKLTGGPALVEAQHRTRTGSVLGTPHYMAPEQCEGKVTVDGRADIYGLGCILFQMLTGELPFPGDGFGEVLVKHLREPVPSVRAKNPRVSPAMEKIVLHCLAKKREYRFQSVGELSQALRDPEAFSALIGNDMRVIAGPLPGDPEGPPPVVFDQPATLIGGMAGNYGPPPPVAPPTIQPATTAPPEQSTVIGGLSPFANAGFGGNAGMGGNNQSPGASGMETVLTMPSQGSAGTPVGGARGGRTMMVDAPATGNNMPTLMPGGMSPYANAAPAGDRRPTTGTMKPARDGGGLGKVAAVVGAVVLLGGLLLGIRQIMLREYTVTVSTEPEGAQVLRDGRPVGTSPYVVHMKRSEPGFKLTLHKDGFIDGFRQVPPGADATLSVKLYPKPSGSPDEGTDDTPPTKQETPPAQEPKKQEPKKQEPKKQEPVEAQPQAEQKKPERQKPERTGEKPEHKKKKTDTFAAPF